MERSIDELLSEAPDTAQAEPETVEAPEAEGQPRDESGRFAAKQTGVEEEPQEAPVEPEAGPPPADQLPREVYEPLKAVRNENRELKAQIEALNQRFAMMQQQPEPQAPPVDFWEDPQAVIASQVQQAIAQAMQAEKQQQQAERINASELAARGRYDDYQDAFVAFQQAAAANPALIQQMTSESDPAEFAYRKGKTAMQLEQVGSIDALIQSERAKWEAEARAAVPVPQQSFPPTTATDGSVGARSGPAWSGPAPIGDLLR